MKTLLEKINDEYNALDPEDNSGHVWWNKFRQFVLEHEFQLWAEENYVHATYPDLWLHKSCSYPILNTDQLRTKYYEEVFV